MAKIYPDGQVTLNTKISKFTASYPAYVVSRETYIQAGERIDDAKALAAADNPGSTPALDDERLDAWDGF